MHIIVKRTLTWGLAISLHCEAKVWSLGEKTIGFQLGERLKKGESLQMRNLIFRVEILYVLWQSSWVLPSLPLIRTQHMETASLVFWCARKRTLNSHDSENEVCVNFSEGYKASMEVWVFFCLYFNLIFKWTECRQQIITCKFICKHGESGHSFPQHKRRQCILMIRVYPKEPNFSGVYPIYNLGIIIVYVSYKTIVKLHSCIFKAENSAWHILNNKCNLLFLYGQMK